MNATKDWQELPLNRFIRLRSGDFIAANEIETDGPYPVYGGNGFRGFTDRFNTVGPIALVGRQGAQCGNVHVAGGEVWVSEHALRCFPEKELDARWLAYALQDMDLNQHSVSAAQPGLSVDNLKHLRTRFPPLETQRRIARFLDQKTARIDAMIAKKRTLLDRLAEKRQAVITSAVSKGLNPDAPMKPSGIDWLGDIPAHWEVVQLRRCITKIEQGWSPAAEERTASEDEWGVLKSGCVNDAKFNDGHKTLPAHLDPRPQYEVKAGDVLMCRASGSLKYIGSVAAVGAVRPRLMFSDKTYRIFLDSRKITRDFFVYSMWAKSLREQIILSVSGADGLANNLPQSSVRAYLMCRPPMSEQSEIAQHIEREIRGIDEIVSRTEETGARLTEYRVALVTAAVTGKIAGLQDIPA